MRLFCLLLTVSTPAYCQDGFGNGPPVEWSERDKDAISDAVREKYQAILAGWFRQEVEHMRGHLELSEADAKRLHVAAKGAVAQMVKENSDDVVQAIVRQIDDKDVSINGVPLRWKQGEAKEQDQEACAVLIEISRVQTFVSVTKKNGGGVGSNGGHGFDHLLSQSVWVRTRDSVLSGDQQKSFAEYSDRLIRSHVAEVITGTLAWQLRLTKNERDKLSLWVKTEMMAAKKFDSRFEPISVTRMMLTQFDFAKLKGVLSVDQITSIREISTRRSRMGFFRR